MRTATSPNHRFGASLRLSLAGVVIAVATISVAVLPSLDAGAAVTNYTDPGISNPYNITTGPDGALWFANDSTNSIGRITTSGTVTDYTGPTVVNPFDITSGPDGALWFTNANSIGRITTSGTVTNYTDPSISNPGFITTGSDGALWYTNIAANSIGRITTSGAVTSYTDPSMSSPFDITAGPDGALWFTNLGNSTIGRITTSGVVTNYTDPSMSSPYGITTGPDGALWFTNLGNSTIGRITTSGAVTNYTDPSISEPATITTGPDGALWFANLGNNSIGRITTAGAVTNYTDPSMSSPYGITSGPDGALWFTNLGNSSIGRVTTPRSTTSITTKPLNSVIELGQADTDLATVTGNARTGSPTGTLTFYQCGPASTAIPCNSMANQVGSAVTLTPGPDHTATATSSPFAPTAVGYWCFVGFYSGDANYEASSDATVDECVDVAGPLTIITTSVPGGAKGVAYSTTLVARGGTTPYRWTHGHLPRGLAINRTTGVLAGTPRGQGTFTITVKVGGGHHPRQLATRRLSLFIAPAP